MVVAHSGERIVAVKAELAATRAAFDGAVAENRDRLVAGPGVDEVVPVRVDHVASRKRKLVGGSCRRGDGVGTSEVDGIVDQAAGTALDQLVGAAQHRKGAATAHQGEMGALRLYGARLVSAEVGDVAGIAADKVSTATAVDHGARRVAPAVDPQVTGPCIDGCRTLHDHRVVPGARLDQIAAHTEHLGVARRQVQYRSGGTASGGHVRHPVVDLHVCRASQLRNRLGTPSIVDVEREASAVVFDVQEADRATNGSVGSVAHRHHGVSALTGDRGAAEHRPLVVARAVEYLCLPGNLAGDVASPAGDRVRALAVHEILTVQDQCVARVHQRRDRVAAGVADLGEVESPRAAYHHDVSSGSGDRQPPGPTLYRVVRAVHRDRVRLVVGDEQGGTWQDAGERLVGDGNTLAVHVAGFACRSGRDVGSSHSVELVARDVRRQGGLVEHSDRVRSIVVLECIARDQQRRADVRDALSAEMHEGLVLCVRPFLDQVT